MRRILAVVSALVVAALWASGARAGDLPGVDRVVEDLLRVSGWADEAGVAGSGLRVPGGAGSCGDFQRTVLYGNVAHYQFTVRVGPGPHDLIRVHRVVKERRPNHPIRTAKNLFLLHGDCVGFVKFIFGSETPYLPDEQSVAVYLALADVDVWGIDQPWALVPGGLTDLTFAAGWGMQFNVDALRCGVSVARVTRFLTGSGNGKMNLLGYSSGGMTGYAYLNEESQRPLRSRHVGGYVVADICYKYDRSDPVFENARQIVCSFRDYYQDMYDQGFYDLGYGALFTTVGSLAETAPDDPSPIYAGMTNLEAALFMAAVPEAASFTPWYHYAAGVFEEGVPVPVDLRFTSIGAWLDFLQVASPFEPTLFGMDYAAIMCDETDVPFDDHLSEITVPILHLGANGGFGPSGWHTLDLLGSTDKTIVNVSLTPPEATDFAHIDLWTAENAPEVVWSNILSWIEERRSTDVADETGASASSLASERPVDSGVRVTPNPGGAGFYTFSFEMPVSGTAAVEIYDIAGRRVATPVSWVTAAGHNQIVWNAVAREGRPLSQGIYFARVTTPEGVRTAKFVHLGP